MKIATYNIWYSGLGWPQRHELIVSEINSLDPDIIGLQEVRNEAYFNKLKEELNYPFGIFHPHEDEDGLAILSKWPIEFLEYTHFGLICLIDHGDFKYQVINVHLPYDSILEKETCIVKIMEKAKNIESDYEFILGDFNSNEKSSIYSYVSGDRSLLGTEVDVYWTDLACVAKEQLGLKRQQTLDLMHNPRWKNTSITDAGAEVDFIFIHDCYPNDYPSLEYFVYFGHSIDEETGYSPSDHYGVFSQLKMPHD
ncbi:endonuclease/exonuclease/phosphatase family protein [Acidaminobacter sp. JC074]|uniref:endonuclease/exonuclease/phosphatase family protein n=1 Tax=Acidaminobacter sp. JC074 TaxID=2530199 RepID=UPI001F0F1B1A|nr:endonuclease/exonuclease/phosphatase family protein [Acidaminobacter sp. JC074]